MDTAATRSSSADRSSRETTPPAPASLRIGRRAIAGSHWLVLLVSVLSYGANTALSLSIASSFAFAVLILAFLTYGEPATSRKPFWFALGLLLALSLWAGVQTLDWPFSAVEAGQWRNVAAFAEAGRVSGSVTSGDTMLGLLKAALPISILLTSLILFDRDDRAIFAVKVAASIGGVIAVLGTLQFVFAPQTLIFEPKQFYVGNLTGPFVNRNTAGTFFGVVSVMLLALAIHSATKVDRYRLSRLLEVGGRVEQPREVAVAAAFGGLFLVAISAVFLTSSRAAIGITFLSLVCLSLLITFGPRFRPYKRKRRKGWRELARKTGIAAVLICVPLIIFSALSGRVQQRFEETGVVDPRFCAAHAIWSATLDHWPKGAGLTSFQAVYPAYRDPACNVNGIWDKAHNFYLEGLFSLGIFFPVALGLSAAVIGRVFWKGFARRKTRYYLVAAGFCATLLVAAHAAFDFSLQIPGFSAFFAAVLGPVITICLYKPAKGQATKPSLSSERRRRSGRGYAVSENGAG